MLLAMASMHALAQGTKLSAPLLDNLGTYSYPIKTSSTLAQRYFNQGMVLFYGFDYGEAIRSFEGAIASDPDCSMCYVGLALALGSKTNIPTTGNEIKQAKIALVKATNVNTHVDNKTLAFINALKSRYINVRQTKPHTDKQITSISIPSTNAINFNSALWQMTRDYPQDANVWALYAYSTFGVTKWRFWNNELQPRANTLSMHYAVMRALALEPLHPGAIHYYIHMAESSPFLKKTLPYAIKLAETYSGAEHLVHMASHVYFVLGDYYQAAQQNLKAITASENYRHTVTKQGFEPITNYLVQHNYYFLLSDTLMAGLADLSYQSAMKLEQITPIDSLKKNQYLERFYAEKYFTIARFGLWDRLASLSPPDKDFTYLTAMWYYIQGLANVHQGNLKLANKMLSKLTTLSKTKTATALPQTYRRNMNIAIEVLNANIATEKSEFDKAITYWQKAVNLQFNYENGDPPSWYLPSNQGLGFAHLRNHDLIAAKFAFDSDLAIHPRNGWSLYGLAQVYLQLKDEVNYQKTIKKLNKAWQHSDIKLPIEQGSDIFMAAKQPKRPVKT